MRGHTVTHTLPADGEKCTTPWQPRWIAAARAVATYVPVATRAERTYVFWIASLIFGKPIRASTPTITITTISSSIVKPLRRIRFPPHRGTCYTMRAIP